MQLSKTHYTSLRRIDARELTEGQQFVYHRQNTYVVICLSSNYIHCLNLDTERAIRFCRSSNHCPDFVYLLEPKPLGRYSNLNSSSADSLAVGDVERFLTNSC